MRTTEQVVLLAFYAGNPLVTRQFSSQTPSICSNNKKNTKACIRCHMRGPQIYSPHTSANKVSIPRRHHKTCTRLALHDIVIYCGQIQTDFTHTFVITSLALDRRIWMALPYIDDLVKYCIISIASALEILQSCTRLSIHNKQRGNFEDRKQTIICTQ